MDDRKCTNCDCPLDDDNPQSLCAGCLLQIAFSDSPKTLHFRCPNCRQPIELLDDTSLTAVACPSCDSRFSLVDGDHTLPSLGDGAERIEQFDLIERVGLGAFGAVWKAYDRSLDRIVAVKLPREQSLSPEEAEAFFREARAAAQLHHPSIVRVYEVGRSDRRVFIVSEFVEGITLADHLTCERLTAAEAARCCLTIAEALEHAHQSGVVHRDLKPSNILLRRTNGSNELLLTDFGLARRDSGEITITIDGRILGTPAYMSPEQARGDGHAVDGRSDLYSLGVLLFELLTGEKPFRGNSRMLIDQVQYQEPPNPRQLNNTVPQNLSTICLKLMEKSPACRYPTATDLAADLSRFLSGHPIHARPVSRVERAGRWCRRNPSVSILTFAIVASLLIGLATTFWQWRISESHRQQAVKQRHQAMNQVVRMQINRGNQALNNADPLEAMIWYSEALSKTEASASPIATRPMTTADDSFNESLLRRKTGIVRRQLPKLLHCFTHDPLDIATAKYNADGSRIVTTSDRMFRLWDTETGEPIIDSVELEGNIARSAFSPSGRLLVVLSAEVGLGSSPGNGRIRILDAATGVQTLPTIEREKLNVLHLSFSPEEDCFAVAVGEQVHVLNTVTGEPIVLPIEHGCMVCQIEISPDGTRMATCGHDIESSAMAVLYDLSNHKEITRWDGQLVNSDGDMEYLYPNELSINAHPPVFSPHGQVFATFEFDYSGGRAHGPQTVFLRSSETGELLHQAMHSENWIDSVRFSIDSETAFVHSGGTPLVYGVRDGALLDLRLPEGLHRLHPLCDGTYLSVRQAASETEVRRHVEGSTDAVVFSGQPQRLVVRGDSGGFAVSTRGADRNHGTLHLYDIAGKTTVSLSAWHDKIQADYHPHADRVLEVRHGIARQWDLAAHGSRRVELQDLDKETVEVSQLSPSGRVLAIGNGESSYSEGEWGRVQFIGLPMDTRLSEIASSAAMPWNHSKDFKVAPSITVPHTVRSIQFNAADESIVALEIGYGEAVIVSSTSREIVAIPHGDDRYIHQIAWRDFETLAVLAASGAPQYHSERLSHSPDMRIEFWQIDTATLQPKLVADRKLPPHQNVFLSASGRRLLLTNLENETLWYNTLSGETIQNYGRLPRRIDRVEFSRDDHRLGIVFDDQRMGVWDTQTGQRIAPLISDARYARFSQDGSELITLYQDESARLWNADTSDPLSLAISVSQWPDTPGFSILPFFSHDKQTLISPSKHGLRLWDVRSDKQTANQIGRHSLAASGFVIDTVGGYVPLSVREFTERTSTHPATIEDAPAEIRRLAQNRMRWHEDMGVLHFHRPYQIYHGWGDFEPITIRHLATRFHLMQVETDRSSMLRRRGIAHRFAGDNVSATIDLDRVLSDSSEEIDSKIPLAGKADLWMHRGLAQFVLGNLDSAYQDIVKAFEHGVNHGIGKLTDPLIAAAAAEGITQRLDSGDVMDQRVITDLRAQRGMFYLEAKMWREAIDTFTEAGVDEAHVRAYRGQAYMALGQWQAAIDDFSKRVETITWYEDAHVDLAGVRAVSGNFKAAYGDFRHATQVANSKGTRWDAHAAWLLALLLDPNVAQKQIVEQQRTLLPFASVVLAAKQAQPNRSSQLGYTAEVIIPLALAGWTEEIGPTVLQLTQYLVSEWPSRPEAWFAHGLTLWRDGHAEHAIEALQQIDGRSSHWSINAALLTATIQQDLGDQEAATAAFDRAKRILEQSSPFDHWRPLAITRILQRRFDETR